MVRFSCKSTRDNNILIKAQEFFTKGPDAIPNYDCFVLKSVMMIRYQQLLVKYLQRINYCNPNVMLRVVPYRSLSLNHSVNHISYNITTFRVLQLSCLPLNNVVVCNKWSRKFSSLIQQSRVPVNKLCFNGAVRSYNATERTHQSRNNRSTLVYTTAVAIVVLGLSYAAVPLYRMFCQVMFM